MTFSRRLFARAAAIMAAAVLGSVAALPAAAQQEVKTASGLRYTDTKIGHGPAAHAGEMVTVHYTGWLYEAGLKTRKFDSSRDRNEPFSFPLGAGKVIKGWDEGVVGMRVGGRRMLIIPPALGYGTTGAGGVIPPNATLYFDVELLRIQ
jgi:FKBP-type peptidyl-prolyl cis-trans isomerase